MKLLKALRTIAALLGLTIAVVTATPLTAYLAGKLARPWAQPKGDILIVLGGSSMDDDLIGLDSYWRAVYAADAYHRDGFSSVLLVGRNVSRGMRELLILRGVPEAAITTEGMSDTTRENAVEGTKLLSEMPGEKVLLTSEYHLYRAVRCFRKEGVEIQGRPIPDVGKRSTSWAGRWPAFLDLIEEYAKIAYYRWNGWI